MKEAKAFLKKTLEAKELENIDKALIFVFSTAGFYQNATSFFKDNGMAWSDDKRFLE